jgi:uncharacterized MAPEG superfamily protein
MTFTVAYGALLAAFMLPYVCAGIAKAGMRGYDNRDPRRWAASLDGFRRRAVSAQANTFEALPFFAAAVIVAHQLGVPQGRLDLLAVAFLLCRIAYIAAYVADRPTGRSLVWAAALFINLWIFLLGA